MAARVAKLVLGCMWMIWRPVLEEYEVIGASDGTTEWYQRWYQSDSGYRGFLVSYRLLSALSLTIRP